jgi:hypothetical protein
MSRKCSKCLRIRDDDAFNWKYKYTQLQYHCKECSRKYVKNHYKNNLKYYLDKARKRNLMVKKRAYAYLGPYLLSHPCVDCGERDILVLEFDHGDRSMKEGEIRHIIQNGATLEKVIEEVKKCDIRCSNCHRRKTEKENNSWKLKYAPVA